MLCNIVKDFFLAMITSYIFYLMVIYFPNKKANKNTKEFVQEYYKKSKRDVTQIIFSVFKRRLLIKK